jgi:preprotein translocase subunit SecY
VVRDPGIGFRDHDRAVADDGHAFLMWLGEQITERGIGNGISLIIFSGIVANLPDAAIEQLFQQISIGPEIVGLSRSCCWARCRCRDLADRLLRAWPATHPGRSTRSGCRAGACTAATSLPAAAREQRRRDPADLRLSLLMFPHDQIAGYDPERDVGCRRSGDVQPHGWRYNTVYVVLIVFFTFFYTAVTFNPVEVADNLKKQNAFDPGVSAPASDGRVHRLRAHAYHGGGAWYISAVCVLPTFLQTPLRRAVLLRRYVAC